MPRLKLSHKLFFLVIGVAALSLVLIGALMQWSITRGFLDYRNRADAETLVSIAEAAAEYYGARGSWASLRGEPQLWRRLLLGAPGAPLRPPRPWPPLAEGGPPLGPQPGMAGPGGAAPFSLLRRVALFDGHRQIVIGFGTFEAFDVTEPVTVEGEVVGWLGLRFSHEIDEGQGRAFVRSQATALAGGGLAVLMLAALASWFAARRILRPIRKVIRGSRRLTAGDYTTRLADDGSDEITELVRHFNDLAEALQRHETARRRWVADISHELRTPITVLRGEIEALLDGIRSVSPEALSSIHQETLQLHRLVEDLYHLALSDLGALDYRMAPVALAERWTPWRRPIASALRRGT